MTLLILSWIPNGFLNKYKNYDINLSQQNWYSTEALKIKKIINSNYNTLFRSYFMEYFMYDFYWKWITYNVFRLDKEDWIKYLSREKWIENILLKKYNIKYIVLYKKQSWLEYWYYPWLNILYKKSLYYKTWLEESKYITKIFDWEYLIVYKIINIYEKQ